MKEVDSLALANAQMNLQAAYNNFFQSPKTGFPKYKSKKSNRRSYTTNYVNGNISIDNGSIKLPKIGFVKLKQHRNIPLDYKLKSATISQAPSGKYYASVLFEYENQVQQQTPTTFLGLDFSMHELYKDNNGNEPCYPKYYRQAEKKLAREQRKLSKMQKGSNNRNKQRIRVAKLNERVANQRKDFLHKES
ncbi:transposase, partial [Diplocloster hominis]|uniref:RNA-guided endonuclease InsQ/TnpB family protein n=1 Tax=Diplocloster hominis TaxID=3079010 RepID=UPI0031BA7E15